MAHPVNPEERADTATFRAGRHVGRNFEDSLKVPRASVVDTEDGEILGFHIVDIGLVDNSQGTTTNIIDVVRMDSSRGLTRAGEVRVMVTNIATVIKHVSLTQGWGWRNSHPGDEAK